MAISRAVPPVPPAHVPLVNPSTGLMSQVWVEYYAKLDAFLREVRAAIP
jgi:hypothetical protein